MKHKVGFRLNVLEMVFVLGLTMFTGMMLSSDMEDKYIYGGLLLVGVLGILVQKRIKIALNKPKNK
jgi:hypothetical protein